MIAGVIVTALVGNRFNIAILGWVATVPWLVNLRRSSGWRSHAALFLAVQLGTFVQMLKIITEPIPWFFAAMFSVPSAAFAVLLLLLFEASRRRLGDGWGLILFPAITVVSEWAAATYSEMGSWGALVAIGFLLRPRRTLINDQDELSKKTDQKTRQSTRTNKANASSAKNS